MVSESASPRDNPTGIKSHPACASIANKAGSAYCGGIFPSANCDPSNVPTTCAITAPGPRTGERIGIPQINAIATIPGNVEQIGEIVFAMTFPSPLAEMIPSSVAVNAINGRIVPTTISIVSRPA